jgi:hypothetical protein
LLPILGRILRSESARREVVREVVKVLGILGALDPYRRKVRLGCALSLQVSNIPVDKTR